MISPDYICFRRLTSAGQNFSCFFENKIQDIGMRNKQDIAVLNFSSVSLRETPCCKNY